MSVAYFSNCRQLATQTSSGVYTLGAPLPPAQTISEGLADSSKALAEGLTGVFMVQYNTQSFNPSWKRIKGRLSGTTLIEDEIERSRVGTAAAGTTDFDFDGTKDLVIYGVQSDESLIERLSTSFLLDEDDMGSDSAEKPSSQQAAKAYTDGKVALLEALQAVHVYAYLGSDITVVANTEETLDGLTEVVDVGGDFNHTTGIFTIPADGDYHIQGAITYKGTGDEDRLVANVDVEGVVVRQTNITVGRNNSYNTIPINWFLYNQTAGDEVFVQTKDNDTAADIHGAEYLTWIRITRVG